jgi:hypothetical protein
MSHKCLEVGYCSDDGLENREGLPIVEDTQLPSVEDDKCNLLSCGLTKSKLFCVIYHITANIITIMYHQHVSYLKVQFPYSTAGNCKITMNCMNIRDAVVQSWTKVQTRTFQNQTQVQSKVKGDPRMGSKVQFWVHHMHHKCEHV